MAKLLIRRRVGHTSMEWTDEAEDAEVLRAAAEVLRRNESQVEAAVLSRLSTGISVAETCERVAARLDKEPHAR